MIKQVLFITIAFLLTGVAAHSEIVGYQSILQEGRVWVNHIDCYDGYHPEECFSVTYSYEMHGDSVLNGLSYKKCYLKSSKHLPLHTDADYTSLSLFRNTPVALIREDGMKVYVKLCDFPYEFLTNCYELDEEYLAYDFEKARQNSPREFIITQESVNGVPCNHYEPTVYATGDYTTEMIESVGACGGMGTLIFPVWITTTGPYYDFSGLSCVLDNNGKIIYKSKGYREPIASGIVEIHKDTVTDDAYYNLQGQRVDTPSGGIYIHGGKKVVVK